MRETHDELKLLVDDINKCTKIHIVANSEISNKCIKVMRIGGVTGTERERARDGVIPTPIRVHPKVVHWLIGRGLSNRLHVSIRRGKNNFDHFGVVCYVSSQALSLQLLRIRRILTQHSPCTSASIFWADSPACAGVEGLLVDLPEGLALDLGRGGGRSGAAGARHASDGGRVVGIAGHCCWFLICGWRGWWRNEHESM